jgi:hypothetical protein
MRTGSAGAATLRHVGLVALEALLVAILVWIAAMTLAGAGESNGLVGAAHAGADAATVSVKPAVHGQQAFVTTTHAADAGWVHLGCSQGDAMVLSRWARLDKNGRAAVRLDGMANWTSGDASCIAEIGYFSPNGRWRVDAASSFIATS